MHTEVELKLKTMKKLEQIIGLALAAAFLALPASAFAGEKKDKDIEKKAKPYKLDTCAVSDEKLGEMGEPFVFAHKGQEYKLCCKSCQKEFNKEPEKFAKKVEKAHKKAEKKGEKKDKQ